MIVCHNNLRLAFQIGYMVCRLYDPPTQTYTQHTQSKNCDQHRIVENGFEVQSLNKQQKHHCIQDSVLILSVNCFKSRRFLILLF